MFAKGLLVSWKGDDEKLSSYTYREYDFSNCNRCNDDYVTGLRSFNFRLHVPLLANRM